MEIKKGYKMTDVGVIPEDWEVKSIGEVLSICNGMDYKHLNIGNYPVYGTGGLIAKVDDYLFEGESVCIGRKGTIDAPIYLNEKTVIDMLAIIEDGFSMVSEISTSNQVSNSLDTKINGGFSTKALLDKLLRIQLDASVESEHAEENQSNVKQEKVHTNVSL